jgi:hypothetical protein
MQAGQCKHCLASYFDAWAVMICCVHALTYACYSLAVSTYTPIMMSVRRVCMNQQGMNVGYICMLLPPLGLLTIVNMAGYTGQTVY